MPSTPGILKEYLGDGVYADFDGYHIVLTTERLEPNTIDRICLEPEVLHNLERYIQRLKDFAAAWRARKETAAP